MLKIIHTADVHLGSKLDANFDGKKMEERRIEIRETFMRIADYAENNGVKIVLLGGDIFDEDKPLKKDKDFFLSVIKSHPEIDFLYLKGNHDRNIDLNSNNDIPNLKFFLNEWTYYKYDNVVIGGYQFDETNAKSLYSTINFEKDSINIAVLHGNLSSSEGLDEIVVSKLKDKNIDYLALGHIHKGDFFKLDERGDYAYSGCPEGRGFDESGDKGFVLLTIDNKVIAQFIPFAKRKIIEIEADVSTCKNSLDAYLLVKKIVGECSDNLLRVILKGEITFDNYSLKNEVEKLLSSDYYCVSVKDKTTSRIDIDGYKNDLSLKGEFVRLVYGDENLTNEEKSKIIRAGLKALMGERPND